VAGVNTFILAHRAGNEGLGFAIPSGVVTVVFQQLRKFGHLHRAEMALESEDYAILWRRR